MIDTDNESQLRASTIRHHKLQGIARMLSWVLMAFLALGIALYAATPYVTFNPDVSRIPLNPAVAWHFTILAIHGIAGGTALLLGPLQFLPRLRTHYPIAHRLIGRIYMICIVIGSLAACYSAVVSLDGFVAQVGFIFLAILWLYSIVRAYIAIRSGNILLHRIWMIRNYALSFAAVILRIWLGIGITYLVITHKLHGPVTFTSAYTSGVWVSWVSTLVFAEWFINQRFFPVRVQKLQTMRENGVKRLSSQGSK